MNYLKFAGLASNWDAAYAASYSQLLFEMGFFAKVISLKGKIIVAYSHKSFTKADIDQKIAEIFSEGVEEG